MSGMITFKEAAAPATPPTGYVRLYAKTDGKLYFKDDAGNEISLEPAAGGGGGGGGFQQGILLSAVNSGTGKADFLAAGAGLNFNVDANPTSLVLDFANGHVSQQSTLTADASNQGSLTAHSLNYLHATYSSASAVTWGACIVPPQYGYSFDQQKQFLLNCEGSDTSTTFIDDFGSTWTAIGNAQIDTAQAKFGSSSILLDGTGDGIKNTQIGQGISGDGDGSWTVEGWVRFAALPGSGSAVQLFSGVNVGGFGAGLRLHNAAGTYQLRLFISGVGTSWNVADDVSSTITTPSIDTWYHFAMCYDGKSGHYRTYWDGTAEHAVASSVKTCSMLALRFGIDSNESSNPLNGWLDCLRIMPACMYPNGSGFTPSASAFTVASTPVHYFSIPEMKMYEVTSASAAAGTNPGMTRRDRVFVGEAVTDGSTPTTVRSYAIRGLYYTEIDVPATSSTTNIDHNLGFPNEWIDVSAKTRIKSTALASAYAGREMSTDLSAVYNSTVEKNFGSTTREHSRNSLAWYVGQDHYRTHINSTGLHALTTTTGAYRVAMRIKRAF